MEPPDRRLWDAERDIANGRAGVVITKVSLRQFTVFERLDFLPSSGIDILIGANATGKTHLMKVAYAACAIVKEDGTGFGEKLVRVFLPSQRKIGRLARRVRGVSQASISVHRGDRRLALSFAWQPERPSAGRNERRTRMDPDPPRIHLHPRRGNARRCAGISFPVPEQGNAFRGSSRRSPPTRPSASSGRTDGGAEKADFGRSPKGHRRKGADPR